jgi:peptide-methionine (S)-S-oxide reductase
MIKQEIATLAGGCFWCLEAVFEQVKGVTGVISGYTGGQVENPVYEAVCGGKTGHAEVVQISFSPEEVTFAELLEVFFTIHDPTTLNRQGNDVGTQYRSAIFYHNETQCKEAQTKIAELNQKKIWSAPVVTEVIEAPVFYPAEAYHQHYFVNHPEQGYCQFVVAPKVEKFRKLFLNS